MKTLAAQLRYLRERPFWAITPDSLEEVYWLLAQQLAATETQAGFNEPKPEARIFVSAAVAKVIGEQLQQTAATGTKIGVIPIIGPLCNDDSETLWTGGTSYPTIQAALESAAADSSITEVMLLVDSPGGDVIGLPETADMINALRQTKPVTAMVIGMAASAAYWLSSQAQNIYLTPSGHVGSVGVLTMHTDISKMLARVGITITPVYAGPYKTELYPFAPLTDEAKAALQESINAVYVQFLSAITRGRGSRASTAMAQQYGGGRLLNAEQAMTSGMVDSVRTMRQVFESRRKRSMMRTRMAELEQF